MRKRSALALASVLLGAAWTPAGALPQVRGGVLCSMDATTADGQTWTGTMQGGPWSDDDPTVALRMTCILQMWTGEGWLTVATAESPQTPGVAVVPPRLISYGTPFAGNFAGPPDLQGNLQLCTQITVYKDPEHNPPTVHTVDADGNPGNGAQCAKPDRADNEQVYVTVVPPRPYHTLCAYWDDEDLPNEVPGEACIPG